MFAAATTGRTSALESRSALAARVVAWVSDVSVSIARFVAMEVVEGVVSAVWQRAVIAMVRIPSVIHVAVEAARAMEPRSGSNENAVHKPVWPVIAVGGAIVGSIVKVPIGAVGRRSKVHAYGNLGLGGGSKTHQQKGESRKSKQLPSGHKFLLNT
jgi:hypothetical protein